MEKRGAINCYFERIRTAKAFRVYTINLAAGVTSFIKHFNDGDSFLGIECHSTFYRLPSPEAFVTHAWYRPTRAELEQLDSSVVGHVGVGGLLCAPLVEALAKQLPGDLVTDVMPFQDVQAFFEKVYGRPLGG